jgi:hypothetical protein
MHPTGWADSTEKELMTEEDQNRLLRGYEHMLQRLREMMENTDHLTRPHLQEALDTAKQRAVELHELTPEEADRISNYLRRDLEEAAHYGVRTDEDLAGWLRMDLQLIENWLWDTFSSVADKTKLELIQFQRQLVVPETYHTGEVAGPGTLHCTNCGNAVHLSKVGHIPPCPKCHGTEFTRTEPDNQ